MNISMITNNATINKSMMMSSYQLNTIDKIIVMSMVAVCFIMIVVISREIAKRCDLQSGDEDDKKKE